MTGKVYVYYVLKVYFPMHILKTLKLSFQVIWKTSGKGYPGVSILFNFLLYLLFLLCRKYYPKILDIKSGIDISHCKTSLIY